METKEFTSELLEVEYQHDVDDVGGEDMRQKMKVELGRSRRLNHADEANRKPVREDCMGQSFSLFLLPLSHHRHHVAS